MNRMNFLPSTSVASNENGIFVPLEPIEHFNEEEYLQLAQKTLEHYQNHTNQVPYEDSSRLKLFNSPATAVIVGTGTVGLEAIAYASRILPQQSTILVFQNDVKDIEKLEDVLKTIIKGGEHFHWIISPPTDLGRLDQIDEFLVRHKSHLEHTQLLMHTADKAKRYLPDSVNYQDVITQIIRRCSIPAIEEVITRFSNPTNPYVRILFSSMCSTNRDKYRLANVGPYQIGKLVGDELFRSTPVRQNSYSFILYSGGMFTMGETLTRNQEYKLLTSNLLSSKKMSEKEYNGTWTKAGLHADSMDSAGLMFKKIWESLQENQISPGKLYSIYGSSVPERLGYELNVLKVVESAPYMFDPLESSPTSNDKASSMV